MKTVVIIVCVMLFLIPISGYSVQNTLSASGVAMPSDNQGMSARARSLGSAFVGLADDSSAIYWNPAGLSNLQYFEIAGHYNTWLVDAKQESVVIGFPLGDFGGLGFSYYLLDYGVIEGRDSTGVQVSSYTAGMTTMTLGWGCSMFVEGLSLGGALKTTQQTLAEAKYTAMSFDVGALWMMTRTLSLGAAYTNISSNVGGSPKASSIRVGGAYALKFGKKDAPLILLLSSQIDPKGAQRIQTGLEYVLGSFLALRGGYQMNLTNNQLKGLAGLTCGLGFFIGDLEIDYAFVPFGDLGDSHQASLSYRF